MALSLESLRSADWALLDQMGSVLLGEGNTTPIEYRPLRGWPFAWLLHDRFTDGLTVADSTSLYRLQQVGLVNVVEWPETESIPGIQLTRKGLDMVNRRLSRSNGAKASAMAGNSANRNESGWQ